MDYKLLAKLVEEEIEYLSAFDVAADPADCKALAALYELREYIPRQMQHQKEINAHSMEFDTPVAL